MSAINKEKAAMRKSLKIIIPLFVLGIGVIVIVALGYVLFSRKGGNAEVVFAATEVGTPQGPNVTKNIGSAGGTLASPDGRLTLTVPQNALTETVAFTIQPITNKAGGGLGLAYRLEPSGKTFTTPLELSLRYNDKDLEGTVPEQLSLVYQDKQGAWRELKAEKLDEAAKTFTFTTTHFTDVSALAKIHIVPAKATLRPGETLNIEITGCRQEVEGLDYKIRKFLGGAGNETLCHIGYDADMPFDWFTDIGTIATGKNPALYTAPSKKPTPNIATVIIRYTIPSTKMLVGTIGEEGKSGIFACQITIVDRGYTASGESHDEVYSGDICDLAKDFTVNGTGLANFAFKFVPSKNPTSGTVSYTSSYQMVKEAGSGSYEVKGIDTDKPRIVLTIDKATATVAGHSVQPSKAGTVLINLTPAGPGECNKK
jgi:hypothetical protein